MKRIDRAGFILSLSLSALLGAAALSPALAQQINGTPGASDATTTIDGKQLPPPDAEIRRRDQGWRSAVETVVGAAHRAAKGGA